MGIQIQLENLSERANLHNWTRKITIENIKLQAAQLQK